MDGLIANRVAGLDGRGLYEADELLWVERQVEALRSGRLDALDRETLAEHLLDMSAGERRELRNRLAVLLLHILKVRHQPGRHSKSWDDTIAEQQDQVAVMLDTTPSLARFLDEQYAKAFGDALRKAPRETGLPPRAFPAEPPMTAREALAYAPPPRPSGAAARP